MSISFDQAVEALAQFRLRYPVFYQRPGLATKIAVYSPQSVQKGLTFEVSSVSNQCAELVGRDEQTFSVRVDGSDTAATLKFREGTPVQFFGYEAGTSISAANSIYSGTVGWFFYLKKGTKTTLVGLTNWHVACSLFRNETPIGARIEIVNDKGRQIEGASVFDFTKIFGFPYQNAWDLALISFDEDSEVLAKMRECEDNTRHAYPKAITKRVRQKDGVRKCGATSPICREGTVTSFGDVFYEDPEKNMYVFANQIFTSPIALPGDSGSVCVDKAANTVSGLIFAGDDVNSVANPMERFGFTLSGYIRGPLEDDPEIPVFESPIERSEGAFVRGTTARASLFEDLPTITTGYAYLGIAVSRSFGSIAPQAELSDVSQLRGSWLLNPPANVLRFAKAQDTPTYRTFDPDNRVSYITTIWHCFG